MRFAQLVIKDTETGKAYMLADAVRSPTGSAMSQTLVDLETNDRRTFEYNVLADERVTDIQSRSSGLRQTSSQALMQSSGQCKPPKGTKSW